MVECDRRKLDAMSVTHSHQGVIAVTSVREYVDVSDILTAAREKMNRLWWWCATSCPILTTWER